MSTFSAWVKAQIDTWRPDDKGWGPITIHHELLRLEAAKTDRVPSARTIANYLRSQGRTRPYRRSSALPDTRLVIGRYAHDVWQMDAEGNKDVANIGRLGFINIKDTYSKVYAQSLPVLCTKRHAHATTSDYQLALRLAWTEFGMNRCVQVDHESVYYDNTHLSPYPTKFHLWLRGMGVEMMLTPKGKPYRQGAAERCHQTLDRQICHHHGCTSYEEFLLRCQVRRKAVNEYLPCRTLQDKAPLEVCGEARHSGRVYSIATEAKVFNQQLVLDYLSSCPAWQRKIDARGCAQLGRQNYYLGQRAKGREVSVTFDKSIQMLVFKTMDQQPLEWRLPLKGGSFTDLAGALPAHQQWMKDYRTVTEYISYSG